MKKLLIVILILPNQTMGSNLQLNNNNNQTIEQDITISLEKKNLSDCTQFQGRRLKECMACQSKESFITNMKELNDYTAIAYWKGLNYKEYTQALNMFTKEEWLAFYKSRQQENQHLFEPDVDKLKQRAASCNQNDYQGTGLIALKIVSQLIPYINTEHAFALIQACGIAQHIALFSPQRDFEAVKDESFGESRIN